MDWPALAAPLSVFVGEPGPISNVSAAAFEPSVTWTKPTIHYTAFLFHAAPSLPLLHSFLLLLLLRLLLFFSLSPARRPRLASVRLDMSHRAFALLHPVTQLSAEAWGKCRQRDKPGVGYYL